MAIKTRSILCAAMLAPAILLSACSGGSDNAGKTTDAAKSAAAKASSGASQAASPGASSAATTGGGGQQTAAAPRDATKDVKIDGCAVKNGAAQVTATVTNNGKTAENYVIAVEVMQGGKRVDGAALLATSVPAGKSVKADQSGTKSDLKGTVTCTVKSVQTMGG